MRRPEGLSELYYIDLLKKGVALCKKPVKHRWQQINGRDGRSIAKKFICNNSGEFVSQLH